MSRMPIVAALVGNPNAGKSALFNALTGARQKINDAISFGNLILAPATRHGGSRRTRHERHHNGGIYGPLGKSKHATPHSLQAGAQGGP